MAIRPSHIKDKTGLETNTREARHARLRSLADSINDTARMARNSLSLLLIVALYLFLTLISSTDENLLRTIGRSCCRRWAAVFRLHKAISLHR